MIETGVVVRITIEVIVFAMVIYAFIRFLQETRGSAVLKGFILLVLLLGVGFATVVRQLRLDHLGFIGNQGLQLMLFAVIVVFQPELRQALVKIGESKVLQRLTKEGRVIQSVVDEIVQATRTLSDRGFGAIIIVERSVGIAGFTEGAIPMEARVTAPLLVTLFYRDTPTHDGAVIIRKDRIVAAGCILPLSQNQYLPPSFGTRHRAAIGATEENDALAIVVSEETRRISVAFRGGVEEGVSEEHLRILLAGERAPAPPGAAKAAS